MNGPRGHAATILPCPSPGTGLGRLWSRGEEPEPHRLEASGIRRRPRSTASGLLDLQPMTPGAAAWRERHRRRRDRQERLVPPGRTTRALRRRRDRRGLLTTSSVVTGLLIAATLIWSDLGRQEPMPLARGQVRVLAAVGRVTAERGGREIAAESGAALDGGTCFRCEEGSSLRLGLGRPGVELALEGPAVLALHELRHDPASDQILLRAELLGGRARFRVEAPEGKVIARIQSPHGSEVWTQRARFSAQVREDGTDWAVADGAVTAVAGSERVVVPSDHGLRSTFARPLGEPRRVNVTRLAWRSR